MKSIGLFVSTLFFIAVWTMPMSAVTLASHGKARMVIVVDPLATPTEAYAARELATNLEQITGATFEVQTNTEAPRRAILVGPGTAARAVFKDVPFDQLGNEELVIRTQGGRLLLAGGRPRGTLYAVSRFLQEQCGVRWWTPWAGAIPKQPTLKVSNLNLREKPAFEYREPFWFTAFDADWAWHNECNGNSFPIPPDKGGHIIYKGFVHTSYALVPPEKYFLAHPEWFSLIKGKRVGQGAQLCLTDPALRDFVVERVKEWLRESPDANIVSVSQNDNNSPCECSNCSALDAAEGSHAGTMLAFVNYVADHIQPEFPNVAIDTLAYQYTRKPPRTIRPRPNVIVRLCSIECNFREPLDGPSNAAFANDIRGWSDITDRLYVWDYVTDFWHYDQPHPNWFTMGPNLRFFQAHHVKGVFEEGAYQSYGSEMAEMRAWVLAQLMWNPQQDDRALIREFLDGYYGKDAGPIIWQYLELLHDASQGYYLACGSPTDVPFLEFKTLAQAEKLWQQAEQAVAGNDELLARVRLGHLPVRYVWLARWDALQKECAAAHATWPLLDSRMEVAQEWREVADGVPGKPWTKVTLLSEGGETPAQFLSPITDRLPRPTLPAGVGVNIHFTTGHEQDLKMIAEAGFKFVRMDFLWQATEPQKGQYDWLDYDAFTTELAQHGLRPYYIFDYSNPLYESGVINTNPVTHKVESGLASPQHPESVAAYARWAAAAADHFRGRGVVWEIWNEPNISFWKPKADVNQYIALALAAAKAVRAADPQACIVGPTTSQFDWKFLEAVFKSGLLEYLSGVSVHPYRGGKPPETAAADYARLRVLIDHYAPPGKKIPIVSGEWGYSTNTKGLSLEKQADYIARQQLSNLLNGVPLSIWYDWKNDGQDPNYNEDNFGTVTYDLQPKPAWLAIRTLTRELSGYRIAQRYDTGNTNDFVLVLTNLAGQTKLAAWTMKKPHSVQYDSGLNLKLNTTPQYILIQ